MRAAVLLILACTSFSAWAESWVCEPTDNVGFKFDKDAKNWIKTTFADKSKYVVQPSSLSNAKWEVILVGEKTPMFLCQEGFSKHEDLLCSLAGEFRFNKKLLKFSIQSTTGWFADVDTLLKNERAPTSIYVMVGQCKAN